MIGNHFDLVGNLTRDPELKTVGGDKTVVSFGIARNENKGGESVPKFFDVEAWGKTAEFIGKYFAKGKPIHIQGRLDYQSWPDKDTGKTRSKIVLVADQAGFWGYKGDSPDAPRSREEPQEPITDEEIPF